MSVVIETTIGDITVDLLTEERPIACLNFIKLCKLKYYNFNLFHTVEQGFIAQSGDPTGAGDGGSSIWGLVEGSNKKFFEAESIPKIHHTTSGLLSLVSAGKNLVGSQFFFTLGDDLTSLDGIHCVIGEVVEGHETLRKLNEAIVDEKFRPYQDIRITHTVILDDPFPDPRGFQIPSRSPSPSPGRLQNGRIAADEDIDDTDGKTMAEIQEMLAEREAKARATILEIVGDIPDAEVAPPENVLFVCKLNPVTTDDDLEIIFSRFGKVKSCEVIRDKKSGDSLQYAFVEFEDQKSCEAAFFKMDNVLIDDRRIHVDFSQSVAKVKWRGKGRGVEGTEGRLDFNNLNDNSNRRDRRGNNYRPRNEPSRMTSEERIKAREERHRAQRERDREIKPRNRSRSSSNSRNHRSHYENRSRVGHQQYRNRSPPRERYHTSSVGHRSRSGSRERAKDKDYARKPSSDRRKYKSRSRSMDHNDRRNIDKRIQRRSPPRQENAKIEQKSSRSKEYHKRDTSIEKESQKKNEKRKKEIKDKKKNSHKSKHKKRKHSSSSDDVSSSESDSSSESSSTDSTSSSTTSSSEDERKKRKTKKGKKKKSKSAKKTKKHKR